MEASEQSSVSVSHLKQGIVDEYERKSNQLLDYLKSLEAAYEKQKSAFEEREEVLEEEKSNLEKALKSAAEHDRTEEYARALQDLKDEFDLKEKLLQREKKRVEELEDKVGALQDELQRKAELSMYRQRREERMKKKLEEQNRNLRKKATVGWMLGSLFEVFLKGETDGGINQIIKMLRKLQKELEDNSPSPSESSSSDYETIEREARHLLAKEAQKCDSGDEALQHLEPSRKSLKFPCAGSLPSERQKKHLRSEAPKTSRGLSTSNRLSQRKSSASSVCARFLVNCYDSQRISCEVCNESTGGELLASAQPLVQVEVLEAKKNSRDSMKIRSTRTALDNEQEQGDAGCCKAEMRHILASMEANIEYLIISARGEKSKESPSTYFGHFQTKISPKMKSAHIMKPYLPKRSCGKL